MPNSKELSDALCRQIELDNQNGTYPKLGFDDRLVTRRNAVSKDNATFWRPPFARDIDKIMYSPYYNRYSDKTQVFSLVKNDDITRRGLHVQLVSRIARTIGRALHLNLDLIEAIALGHDIGHPPFAHTGERYLNQIYHAHTGRFFCHNIHSVRVLDGIFPKNLTLQVLDGIAAHNGEVELETYYPDSVETFQQFDQRIEMCYQSSAYANKILPSTLEAAVVRVSDIIAYLGKDRQDAARIGIVSEDAFDNTGLGTVNSRIINSLVVNIVENSYGNPFIRLDHDHFMALKKYKKDNYAQIYENEATRTRLHQVIKPMMAEIYDQLLEDLKLQRKNSPIFSHHIAYVNANSVGRAVPYEVTEPNQMVVDYIASMTDDYFIDLHHYMFPDAGYELEYTGYFDDDKRILV